MNDLGKTKPTECGDIERQYLAFVDERIAWFSRHAKLAHWYFNASRLGLVILSGSLPAVISYGYTTWSAVIAVGIAILAGLDSQFRPGDQWRHNRLTAFTLMRLKRIYECKAFDEGDSKGAFEEFRSDIETSLAEEASQYFKFRVTDWQAKK